MGDSRANDSQRRDLHPSARHEQTTGARILVCRGKRNFRLERKRRGVGDVFLESESAGRRRTRGKLRLCHRARRAGPRHRRQMCLHSLERAKERGFRAMQFNFVVSTNERAIKLWASLDFKIVGRLPLAFEHPSLGFVDALVLFRQIS